MYQKKRSYTDTPTHTHKRWNNDTQPTPLSARQLFYSMCAEVKIPIVSLHNVSARI